jgi:hypothetical protein
MPVRFPVLSVIAAALVAMPDLAAAQGGSFCLKSALGALSCSYHSMILCEQAKQPNSRDQCIPRFQADETRQLGSAARQPASARNEDTGRQCRSGTLKDARVRFPIAAANGILWRRNGAARRPT